MFKKLCLVLTIVIGEWLTIGAPGLAVQIEDQAEKEANFKRQALGGLFNLWTFDTEKPQELPSGFSSLDLGEGPTGVWQVVPDEEAPTKPNVLRGMSTCQEQSCYRLVVAEKLEYEYPDITVRLQLSGDAKAGVGGIVFGVRDAKNFYAVTVDLVGHSLEVTRVLGGKATVLGQAFFKPKDVVWHTLRVQRNTIISKDFVETFFDGQLAVSVEDQSLGLGRVGLLVKGKTTLSFDSLHAVPLFSQRPLSPPAAY
jgi:hypothetical protein